MNAKAQDDRRMEHWHLSKNVSISTISGLVGTIVVGSIAYGQATSKLDAVHKDLETAIEKHITKESVNQMLANRDIKIEIVAEDVKDLKSGVKENQQLLIELLQRIPKPQ